jgi:hypothetical protein
MLLVLAVFARGERRPDVVMAERAPDIQKCEILDLYQKQSTRVTHNAFTDKPEYNCQLDIFSSSYKVGEINLLSYGAILDPNPEKPCGSAWR